MTSARIFQALNVIFNLDSQHSIFAREKTSMYMRACALSLLLSLYVSCFNL